MGAATDAAFAGTLIIALLAFMDDRRHASPVNAKRDAPAHLTAPPTLQPVVSRRLIPVDVLRVIDGDTLEVRAEIWLEQWIVTRVRLRDIDAPELAARCRAEAARAEAARSHLAALVAQGPLFLTDLGRDKYGGRVLAHLIAADGRDLGQLMLREGHARAYSGRQRETWC